MSYFDKGKAAKAAYYTALVLIAFILIVSLIIRFPEIAFIGMFIAFATIAILAVWFFIYKSLK
jgi:hypothetical protein